MKTVVACSNAEALGKKLVEECGFEVAGYSSRKFPDGEVYVKIEALGEKDVVFVQAGYPNPNDAIIELLFAADAAKELRAEKLTAVIPYFPYARQDKIFKEGESLSLRAISKALQSAGISKLITVDAHCRSDYGSYSLYGLQAENVSAGRLLVEHVKKKFGLDSVFVISPDFGASELVANAVGEGDEQGKFKKTRSGDYDVSMEGELDVKGKCVLVLDDIISTGGTMRKAIEKARDSGAEKIFAAATHGIFGGDSVEKLRRGSDYLVTTDSIKNETTAVSLAGVLAGVLK
jgi:ribose-phosphate pyrophosphokinase